MTRRPRRRCAARRRCRRRPCPPSWRTDRRACPAVICVRTNPGRTIRTLAPLPTSESAEALAERVGAGLRGPVDEVVLPGPLAGHRGDDRERPVALRAEPVGDDQAGRHRAHVVGGDGLGGMLGVLLEVLLGAEDTERDQHHVEVAVTVEHLADHLLVRRGVVGVEGDRLHGGGAGRHAGDPPGPAGPRAVGPASTTVRQPPLTSRSTVARAISEPPPSTSTDCTPPRASRMGPGPPCQADGSRQSGTAGTAPPPVASTPGHLARRTLGAVR